MSSPSTRRAISMNELFGTKFKVAEFDQEWQRLIGNPELRESWFICGQSSNGKTTFALQLCNYLSLNFGRVLYNSIEEGLSESFRLAVRRAGITADNKQFLLLDKEPIPEMIERLKRPKSANIVVIDSIQEAQLSYIDFQNLRETFPNKLIIYISRAEGRHPDGATARAIKYCANVKIWVEGYVANCRSRYGGEEDYTIWEAGASEYYNLTQK